VIAAPLLLASLLAGAAAQPDPQPERLTPQQAEALVREVSAAVEQLRALKFKTPVKMEVIEPAAARESFKAKIKPWVEDEARHTQAAFVHLGLIPPHTDLITSQLDTVEKDVLGYYEPGSKVFYLLSHVSADDVRGVVAHELTHALEDQHYDLEAVAKRAEGDSDRATAISAVVEGSAMAVTLAYLSRQPSSKKALEQEEQNERQRARRLASAPSFTQRALLAPYFLGFTFLLRGKPWVWQLDGVAYPDLDQAYREPPRSTRQILHPEQYWASLRRREAPQPLTLPDLSKVLGPGWSKVTEGSIGELGLAVMTGAQVRMDSPEVLLPARWTNRAAAGILADLYQHYVSGEQRVTVLATRWETEDDAQEFDAALKYRGQSFFRMGCNVLLLAGDVGDKAEALALAALQGARYFPPE
jgi:hypothetical protein